MKVLFVTQNGLFHYRIPIFSLVNAHEDIELSLAHCGNEKKQSEIPELLLELKKLGPFYYFKNFEKICTNFDVILCMAYFQNLSILKMLLKKNRHYKIILWGIGVRASTAEGHTYDSKSKLNGLKEYFWKKGDALLFYTDYPIAKHENKGIPREKMFVANNTVRVIKKNPNDNHPRDCFLFVGTLYETKQLGKLINAYAEAYKQCPKIYNLTIVGDGDKPFYEKMIKEKLLEDKVTLTGGIYDEERLAQQFDKSILCFSPNQAGLSVLKSLGYGVPFVTASNAITGGERFNIIDGETGFYCDTEEAMTNLMIDSYINPQKYRKVGKKAYQYYWNNRTPEIMAQGIIDAIEYVSK